jgi:Uma2 family endonuclease
VPDVAGWRQDRLPELPRDEYIRAVPDWVCEILTPFTRRYNLLVKKDYYARLGVPHLWLADRAANTLTAYQLESGNWVDVGTYADEIAACIPPFEAANIDVKGLWG